jgi:hypothetical protein
MLPAVRRRQLASTLSELASMMDAVDGAPVMFFEEKAARASRRNRIS